MQKYDELLDKLGIVSNDQQKDQKKNPKTVLLFELRNSPTFDYLGDVKLSRIEDGT